MGQVAGPGLTRFLNRSDHPKRKYLLGGWNALGAHATIHCDQAQAKTDQNDASEALLPSHETWASGARPGFPETNVSGGPCRKRAGSLVLETSSVAALEPTAMQCSSASLLRTFLGDGPADAKGARASALAKWRTDMRKVITGAFLSLDGVMQAPGGPEEDPTGGFKFGGWVWPHTDEVFGQALDKMFGQPFDLLLGRKTYEIFAAHWPYGEGGEHDSIAKLFNSTTKYVATRSTMNLTWTGSVVLHDATADVARLKREDGPALVTQGSSDLIQSCWPTI